MMNQHYVSMFGKYLEVQTHLLNIEHGLQHVLIDTITVPYVRILPPNVETPNGLLEALKGHQKGCLIAL